METLPQTWRPETGDADRRSDNVSPLPPVRYTYTPTFVTPEMARRWLGSMKEQRRFRRGVLAMLARAIGGRRWRMMPHGIVIGTNGSVLDGQHRLQAIADGGTGQWLVVCEGCPPEFYGYIDNAMSPKNLEDALRKDGCPPNVISPVGVVTRLLWRRETLPVAESEFTAKAWPTNDEGLEVYRRYRATLDEAGELAQRAREWCASPGTLAYVLFHGLRAAPEKTREFAEILRTGLTDEEGHPALFCRNAWMKDKSQGVVRWNYDLATQAAATLTDHIRGRKRKSWRGVDFGTGKMPPVGR